MHTEIQADLVVLGSGPGGYTAAFRAADLGQKVVLVEQHKNLGGVCLNVGCIPSKALLHVAKVLSEAKSAHEMGITFEQPAIDIKKVRAWVEKQTVNRLTTGLKGLAKQRKVEVVRGWGQFSGANQLEVLDKKSNISHIINFKHAIIAVGSRPIKLPFMPDDPRVMDSTSALELKDIPKKMLVLGGGIIGMEMGTVYNALGSGITVVEMTPNILSGVDTDLVAPLAKRMGKCFDNIYLETKVTQVDAKADGLYVTFSGKKAPAAPERFDKILSAVGRTPNGGEIKADKAGVNVDAQGFINVDNMLRTNVPHIFAIGDVVGNPMLAHKAVPEGKIAAEVIAGKKHVFEPKCIPNVAYTDPEVAWVGLTETEAKAKGISYQKGVFPWMASGRALAVEAEAGMTKVLFNEHNRIIGAGIVGAYAGDLIAEAVLAIEMDCDVEDIALTIHPHPTLAETIAQAAEMFHGSATDLISPNKKKK